MRTSILFFLASLLSITALCQKNISFLGQIDYTPKGSSLWGYTAPDGHEWVLMGTATGTSVVDIANPSNPKQKFFVAGSNTSWREMKTYGEYGYVSLDGTPDGRQDNGILILNLKYLPDSLPRYYWKGDATHKLENSHTLTIADGYLYINGHDVPGTNRGVVICDIFTTPDTPRIVGLYNDDYVHDCFVRNDTMWTAEVYTGYCSVVDISDKSAPQKLTTFQTPFKFTHNTWLSDDSKTLYTTDEKSFATVGVYDVSDIFDINLVAQFQSTPGTAVIPHNVRVLNDFLVIAYYTDGVIIADAQDPENIIKTGYYDTSPTFSGGTFNGCWEAYPYFNSGIIAASDLEKGLILLRPDYIRACYLHGIAKDYFTGEPLANVRINISTGPDTSSTRLATTRSKDNGTFKTGVADAGNYTAWAYLPGYYPVIKTGQNFSHGDTTYIEFRMIADSIDTIGLSIGVNPVISLHIFPTITRGNIIIELPENTASLTGILYDITGKAIRPVNLSGSSLTQSLFVRDLPTGRYTLLLKDIRGKFYSASFIRQ